jgi:acetoin utilization protein AcuB
MTRKLLTITKDTSVRQAARMFIDRNVSCLPVVGEDRKILGILTWKDILRAVLSH